MPCLDMRAALALLLLGCVPRATDDIAVGAPAETALFADALWDDGNAEIASYRVRADRYGILRDGSAILITVKELFDADALVKADGPLPPVHGIEVIKLNHVLTLPAGVYTYHQMASVFVRRTDLRPLELVIGSQEWCGVTHKRLEVRAGAATLYGSSYFGGESERAFHVPIGDRSVWADALPAWLRALDLERTGRRQLQLLGTELSNRVRSPQVTGAEVEVGVPSAIEVAAGRFEAVPVQVTAAGALDVYWFERSAPHRLLRWDRRDGGVYELEWTRRARYWEMNRPEFEGAFVQPP